MDCIFEGVATALYTPFTQNGIDFEQFERCIDRQLSAKVDALVFLGTTGESATITHNERKQIIEFAVSKLKGKLPIIVGAGSNCTKTAIELSLQAKELGADCVLSVTPYYNRCEQDGIFAHYKSISSSAKIPLICYNVPKRTGVNIEPKTAKNLCKIDYVVGLKEANTDLSHIKTLFSLVGNKMNVYSGSDELTKDFLTLGAKGLISVASNIIPLKIKDFISDFQKDYDVCNFDYNTFFNLLFCKINPIPVKYIASVLFGEDCIFRLPLTHPNLATQKHIISQLKTLGFNVFDKKTYKE